MDKVTLEFDTDALHLIAKVAQKRKVGARALRGILESIMLDYMFEAPDKETKEITVTTKDINTYIKTHLSKEIQDAIKADKTTSKEKTDKKKVVRLPNKVVGSV